MMPHPGPSQSSYRSRCSAILCIAACSTGLFLSLLSLGYAPQTASAGSLSWTPANNGLPFLPDSSAFYVSSLAISPNFAADHTLFAGSFGLWRSTDGGSSWSDIAPTINPQALAISSNFAVDQTLFASTGFDVYRSTDKGGTWLSSSACCGAGLGVSPDYTHDQTVFALGSQDGLLYRSTNGGTNWTKAAQPGLSPALWAISPQYTPGHGITIWAAAKVSSSGPVGQLARSSDGATTWSTAVEVNRSHYPMAIAFSPAFDTDGTALAATEAGSPSGTYAGFYATTTGGTTWPISGLWSPCTQANGCPDNGSAAAFSPDYKSDQTAFVGTLSDGVWRTTNGVGGSWAKGVFPVPRTVQNLVVSPTFSTDELVWAGTAGAGIFVSSSRGQTWSAFNTGLADLRVNSLAASPAFAADKTLLAATDSGLWAYTYGSGPRRVYLPRVTSP